MTIDQRFELYSYIVKITGIFHCDPDMPAHLVNMGWTSKEVREFYSAIKKAADIVNHVNREERSNDPKL